MSLTIQLEHSTMKSWMVNSLCVWLSVLGVVVWWMGWYGGWDNSVTPTSATASPLTGLRHLLDDVIHLHQKTLVPFALIRNWPRIAVSAPCVCVSGVSWHSVARAILFGLCGTPIYLTDDSRTLLRSLASLVAGSTWRDDRLEYVMWVW